MKESAAPPSSPFLLDARRDLGLLVAAPLWIAPLLYFAASGVGDRAVNEWVMSLGAIGHHLPGMLRAYGDRALWMRFRTRFVVAPLVLVAMSVGFSASGLHGIVLIAFLWGVWHGMMQTYGFARIYGARAGAGDRETARHDLALLAAWFAAGVVFSPLRMVFLLEFAGQCGVPLPSVAGLEAFRWAVGGAVLIATAAWLVHWARRARSGRPAGEVRLLLLATSIAFWWFANVRVRHPLLGMPLFEFFHDVQYLAIVWVFNRRRTQGAGSEMSAAMRRLFAPSKVAVGAYVVAVAAYGAIGLWKPAGGLGEGLTGLLAASSLLHFYYDGFIWKVREPATGEALGVVTDAATPRAVPALAHAALWAILVLPAVALAAGEVGESGSADDRVIDVADRVPDSALTQFSAAEVRWKRGDRAAALEGYRRALESDPDYMPARRNLAISIGELADEADAAADRARLRPLADELARLTPRLDRETARFAEQRLEQYRRTLRASWR